MPYHLDLGAVQAIVSALCGSYDVELEAVGARVRILARALPGTAVCAILPDLGDGVLRIVYDLAKPNASRHTQFMIKEWWEALRQPVAFPDGSVEMLTLPCPRAGEGPVRVRVLSNTD